MNPSDRNLIPPGCLELIKGPFFDEDRDRIIDHLISLHLSQSNPNQ